MRCSRVRCSCSRDAIEITDVIELDSLSLTAAVAAVWENRDDAEVQEYMDGKDGQGSADGSQHVVVKACKSQAQLENCAAKLKAEGVLHRLWVEQPEGIPTALASKPYRRSFIAPYFKKFNLYG